MTRRPGVAHLTVFGALVTGLVAGAAATYAKTQAEAVMQPAAEKIWPPSAQEKQIAGADASGHPENMPPAEVVEGVVGQLTGSPVDDDTTSTGAAVLHWATGVGGGLAYVLAARRWPAVRVGGGVPAGLALYAATHGSTLPALGLQPLPWRMPPAALAWEAGSHAVYGAVLDLGVRAAAWFAH